MVENVLEIRAGGVASRETRILTISVSQDAEMFGEVTTDGDEVPFVMITAWILLDGVIKMSLIYFQPFVKFDGFLADAAV